MSEDVRAGGVPPVVAVDGGWVGDALVGLVREAVGDNAEVVAAGPEALPEGAKVLLTLPTERPALERYLAGEVRWVHVLAAGVDGFPLDVLDGRTLTCSRGATAPAIAEFVLAAMLAFEKDLPAQWVSEEPERWNFAQLGGLAGRTLGLIGIGAIGSEVARRALAFDMEVIAVRRTGRPSPEVRVTVVPSVADLLGRSDHIVVAAPATAATAHLLDAAAFAVTKPGAHLVNVARGTLVDQDALRLALDEGIVAMASLDVVDPEPLPDGHWMYTHPRTRISAHVSWSSPSTLDRTIGIFVDNLRRFGRGEALRATVDPVAGY